MSGTSDPWVTYSGLSLTQQNTDLGTISLPAALTATAFPGDRARRRTLARRRCRAPLSVPTRRCRAATPGCRPRSPGRVSRTAAARSTCPSCRAPRIIRARTRSASSLPRARSGRPNVSITSRPSGPAGRLSRLLRDVTLPRRAVIIGKRGVGERGAGRQRRRHRDRGRRRAPVPHCLVGPAVTGTTTDATGSFTLPLDPGTYQLEYDPPAGSPFPRMIESASRSRRPTRIAPPRPPARARPRGG